MKRRILLGTVAALTASGLMSGATAAESVLRIVPHADLSVLDPIWTTAYITRNYGYMVYDTLFSEDAHGDIQPQMVEKYDTSADGKVWTFKLRDGLAFHDGKPVTSEDVVASLKRWAARDALGGVLAGFIDRYETPAANTFKMVLKEPCGIVLDALGKPSSNVPFIMPASAAATPPGDKVTSTVGSGPFIFKTDEFKPGAKIVFIKNTKYKSRSEAPNGLAGGRPVNVDRVEWVIIRDPQTQFNALQAGEVDLVEAPAFEQYYTLKKTPGVKVDVFAPAGLQYIMRFNHMHPPFNNQAIRQAAMVAMGQQAYINTQVGVPELGKPCRSIYPCGTAFADENTGYFTGKADPQKAAQMLKDAGYDGTPVVMMRPTDLAAIAKIPLVAKQQLEAAGFKVDFQQMDWASLVARRAKKDLPKDGGWNVFLTAWTAGDIQSPVTMAMLNAKGDKGWFGWQNEPRIEDLKGKFARSTQVAEKKRLASQIQAVAIETATHAPLGQYVQPSAMRDNVTGLITTPGVLVSWGVKKN